MSERAATQYQLQYDDDVAAKRKSVDDGAKSLASVNVFAQSGKDSMEAIATELLPLVNTRNSGRVRAGLLTERAFP